MHTETKKVTTYNKRRLWLLLPELLKCGPTCFSPLAALPAWRLGCFSVAVGQSDRQENEERLFPLLAHHKAFGLVCLYAGRVAVPSARRPLPAPSPPTDWLTEQDLFSSVAAFPLHQNTQKDFYLFMRCLFRGMQVYRCKHVMETLYLHLLVSGCDERGHVTSSLQMKTCLDRVRGKMHFTSNQREKCSNLKSKQHPNVDLGPRIAIFALSNFLK